MHSFFMELIANVVSGLIFAFILFLFKEYLFPMMQITGEWETTLVIAKTLFAPYQDVDFQYKVHLLQNGNRIRGSGERIKDLKRDGTETVYEPGQRIKIKIEGYYEKKYLRKSKVFFNVIELGNEREIRLTFFMEVKNSKFLKGTFTTTASDSSGTIEMRKK